MSKLAVLAVILVASSRIGFSFRLAAHTLACSILSSHLKEDEVKNLD